MKSLLFILFTVFASQSFAQTVINDKNVEERNVPSFSAIKVSGGIEVYLSQADNEALAVSASDEETRNDIKTEVKNGVLNIWFDGGKIRFNSNRNLRAYISFKTLQSLEASGACEFIVNDIFKAHDIRIKLSGACDMKGKIDFDNLQLDMSGASTFKAGGYVRNLKTPLICIPDSSLSKQSNIPSLRNEHAGIWKKIVRAELFIGGAELLGATVLILAPKEITKWSHDWEKDAWRHMKRSLSKLPVWDDDEWPINFIGHPVAGSFHYNSLRSQNASIFQSFPCSHPL